VRAPIRPAFFTLMSSYAIIKVSGKQYRVGLGERLLVDRLKTEPGKTFAADVLLAEGDLDSKAAVTVRVVDHVKGPKIRIGKYKAKSGYKKHTGFRASLTQIEIESIGSAKAKPKAAAPAAKPASEKAAPAPKAEAPAPKPAAPAKPEAAEEAPKGLPKDYAGLTVAAISEAATGWNRPMLEAALQYEQEHAKRKGALAAIESALAAKENS
jgi:large subunit ribosomal protein L21